MPGKKPTLQIEDPSEALIKAFNERTAVLEKEVNDLRETYQERLEGLQASFQNAAERSEKIMHAVIIVMVVGFISLLFALIAIIATSWQAKSEADASSRQAPNIELMLKNQEKILNLKSETTPQAATDQKQQ